MKKEIIEIAIKEYFKSEGVKVIHIDISTFKTHAKVIVYHYRDYVPVLFTLLLDENYKAVHIEGEVFMSTIRELENIIARRRKEQPND